MNSLKQFVNTPDVHEAFLVYVKDKISSLQKSLEQCSKLEEIYRLQGQIIALRRLLGIREEINSDRK
jgi:hypothetical protein